MVVTNKPSFKFYFVLTDLMQKKSILKFRTPFLIFYWPAGKKSTANSLTTNSLIEVLPALIRSEQSLPHSYQTRIVQ